MLCLEINVIPSLMFYDELLLRYEYLCRFTPILYLNKANTSDTEVPFLDLHLSISNGLSSPKVLINAMTLILIL